MRICTAWAAAGPRGIPTIRRLDHHSQQSRRLARLRGLHHPPFVSPAGAQRLAPKRQRGRRRELLPGQASIPVLLCSGICSQTLLPHLEDHINLGRPGVRLPGRWGLSVLSRTSPSPMTLLPTTNSRIWSFLKSTRTEDPVAWTTGRREGPPSPSDIPPCGRGHSTFVRWALACAVGRPSRQS